MKETQKQQSADLKTMGLKVTVPRLKILDLFQKLSESREVGKRHLSAEEVYKLLLNENSDIGLATVYRVLTQFENAGILVRHHFDEGRATYELQEGRHHDHIVCVRCGKVEEFVDPEIEKAQRQVATRLGYEMTDHSLVLYGVCQECREKTHHNDEDAEV
ncbi:ferric iron uptake transcriptional regulator [uncultured Sutterella sp.]|uniref:ferric iron uptake transcriptional regulator n=1 Tax=uncultured Sutterella sp. TaxID=286133 RepID=UPI0025E5C2A0|nr:ferric iron uptake transcriptional regulator [uncultured Sutterella sp.]